MKKRVMLALAILALLSGSLLALTRPAADATATTVEPAASSSIPGMMVGTPDLKSANVLTFNSEGLLFVGDSLGGAVFAIDVKDTAKDAANAPVEVKEVDKKIASLLGTTPDGIVIHDLATHPISQNVYLAVSRGRGASAAPVILKVNKSGAIEEVPLTNVQFGKVALTNAPGLEEKTRDGQSKRAMSITDLAFSEGALYVSGLSNEEFASNVRRIPFPFTAQMTATSMEVFHTSHNRYETESPIETLLPIKIKGQPHLLASYTCTPLASFSIADMKDKKLLRGTTIAELGGGNRPLDMISFQRDGKTRVLIANSHRTLMSIQAEDIESATPVTTPVTAAYVAAGVRYLSIARVGVMQLDNLNDNLVVVIQRDVADGTLNLRSMNKRAM